MTNLLLASATTWDQKYGVAGVGINRGKPDTSDRTYRKGPVDGHRH